MKTQRGHKNKCQTFKKADRPKQTNDTKERKEMKQTKEQKIVDRRKVSALCATLLDVPVTEYTEQIKRLSAVLENERSYTAKFKQPKHLKATPMCISTL